MRLKDFNWDLPEGAKNPDGGSTHQWETVHSALLMDIRDELQALNAILHCANFLQIPAKLDQIQFNTRKQTKKKNGKARKLIHLVG